MTLFERLLAIALSVAVATGAFAADVPVKLQTIFFKKIFLYDRTLSGKSLKVVVAYADENAEADELAQAFRDLGIEATAVKASNLAGTLGGISAVYLLPHAVSPSVRETVAAAKVLSLGGVAAQAEKGDVGVALSSKDGKPEIVVNVATVQSQGHELSSDLLNLARVIK